jgi:hypothetical protein
LRDTLHLGDGTKHEYQSAQTVIELTLTEEYAKINELTGKIRLPGDLVARAADKSIRDSIMEPWFGSIRLVLALKVLLNCSEE